MVPGMNEFECDAAVSTRRSRRRWLDRLDLQCGAPTSGRITKGMRDDVADIDKRLVELIALETE
jgi:hypothetical protein